MKTHDNKGILSTGIPINTNDKGKAGGKSTTSADNPPEIAAALRLNRVVDMSSIAKHPKSTKTNATKPNGQNSYRKPPSDANAKPPSSAADSESAQQAQPRNRFNKNSNSHNNSRISSTQNAVVPNNDDRNNTTSSSSTAQRRISANSSNAAKTRPAPSNDATPKDRLASSPTVVSTPRLSRGDKAQTNATTSDKANDVVTESVASAADKLPKEAAAKTAKVAAGIKKHAVRVAFRPVAKKDRTIAHAAKLHKHATKNCHTTPASPRASSPSHVESLKIEQSLMLQSWHACLWCSAMTEMSQAVIESLPNSLPLVSAGLVNNICITPGCLEATIFDQVVSIELRQFAQGQWRNVIAMLSDRAIFTTSLLNGELPMGIVEIFKQASLSLFPTRLREFTFHCNCKSQSSPCEHACALLIAFAQKLEEDPFNILTLRGITRDSLLSMLRSARSDQIVDEKTRYRISYELPAQSVSFTDFYLPRGSREGHESIDDVNFHISYAPTPLLRRLGSPAIWDAPMSVESILQPIIEAAAREAEMLGQCEYYEIPVPTKQTPTAKRAKQQSSQNQTSRAPRNSDNNRDKIPDMAFVEEAISPEILAELSDEPIRAAKDIYRWLLTRGASDIRTLARRTRLNKTTIEAFLNAFQTEGIVSQQTLGDKVKFSLNL